MFNFYWRPCFQPNKDEPRFSGTELDSVDAPLPEIGILLPNNQRHHCTLHSQKDVLPCALCQLRCPVPAALASILRMDSISTSYNSSF